MKLLTAVLALSLFAIPAMAQEIVVQGGPASSCSTADGTSGFEVSYFALGGTDASPSLTGGSGAGKPNLSNLTIHKQFNACSEQLLKDFLKGSHIPVLTLTEYLTNAESKSRIPILTITLNEAFITNYQITNADTLHSSEVVAFSYVGVCISSTAVTPQGAAGAKTTVCYNKATNTVS